MINTEFEALPQNAASSPPTFGDAGSVLGLLYEAYSECNQMDDEQARAGFHDLYTLTNDLHLEDADQIINVVCTLCRDYERGGFIHGVRVGALLNQELYSNALSQSGGMSQ